MSILNIILSIILVGSAILFLFLAVKSGKARKSRETIRHLTFSFIALYLFFSAHYTHLNFEVELNLPAFLNSLVAICLVGSAVFLFFEVRNYYKANHKKIRWGDLLLATVSFYFFVIDYLL